MSYIKNKFIIMLNTIVSWFGLILAVVSTFLCITNLISLNKYVNTVKNWSIEIENECNRNLQAAYRSLLSEMDEAGKWIPDDSSKN